MSFLQAVVVIHKNVLTQGEDSESQQDNDADLQQDYEYSSSSQQDDDSHSEHDDYSSNVSYVSVVDIIVALPWLCSSSCNSSICNCNMNQLFHNSGISNLPAGDLCLSQHDIPGAYVNCCASQLPPSMDMVEWHLLVFFFFFQFQGNMDSYDSSENSNFQQDNDSEQEDYENEVSVTLYCQYNLDSLYIFFWPWKNQNHL